MLKGSPAVKNKFKNIDLTVGFLSYCLLCNMYGNNLQINGL